MGNADEFDVSELLTQFDPADRPAAAELLPVVYQELRHVARKYLSRERPDHTLQTTALVHEAYLRLGDHADAAWTDRAHFFRVAAKTMRRILMNHARDRRTAKRGGGAKKISLEDPGSFAVAEPDELIALDDALSRFAQLYPQKAKIVELRHFGGCTIEETAAALDIGTATVERDWRFARAWLFGALSPD